MTDPAAARELDRPRDPSGAGSSAGRTVRAVVAAMALVVAFFVVTSWTGLPGPGGARRFPTADLQHLADQINQSGDCSSWLGSKPMATVDWFRSRVHLTQPSSVALGPHDRPMVDDPPEFTARVTESRTECVGRTGPG